jgi:single-strand DNA-binding protein
MSDINSVIIVGRLTEKPKLKTSNSGSSFLNMSIANNIYAGQEKDKVNFFNIVVFGKRAESCQKFLDKGSLVGISGKLDWNSWETNDGQKRSAIKIIANEIQFLGSSNKQGNKQQNYNQDSSQDPSFNDPDFL